VVQADNEQLEASLAAANSQVNKLQGQLNSLNQLQQGLQASLEGKQSAEASLMTQLTQVGADWTEMSTETNIHSRCRQGMCPAMSYVRSLPHSTCLLPLAHV
jgi:chromosome segregation ATPase